MKSIKKWRSLELFGRINKKYYSLHFPFPFLIMLIIEYNKYIISMIFLYSNYTYIYIYLNK